MQEGDLLRLPCLRPSANPSPLLHSALPSGRRSVMQWKRRCPLLCSVASNILGKKNVDFQVLIFSL